MTSAKSFSWLHLTDLHVGLGAGTYLWPNVRDRAVLPDLAELHKRCGPWHAVFFTGDLTQKGVSREFKEFDRVLAQLREHLKTLGSNPVILAVPGNHDLIRPDDGSGTQRLARDWSKDVRLREQFWKKPRRGSDDLRSGVTKAFKEWTKWWRSFSAKETRVSLDEGLLPGDFRVTIDTDGLRIGVIGLNTAFLQLEGGDRERKLSLDAQQLHALCKDGGDPWAAEHDVCFLLTHHPPSWLDAHGENQLRGEIAPVGRFALHLYGHQHDGRVFITRESGAQGRLEVLGRALFGMEHWGDAQAERFHGYSAGKIDFDGVTRKLRLWPREGRKQHAGHWAMRADSRFTLNADEALVEDLGENPRRLATASDAPAPIASPRSSSSTPAGVEGAPTAEPPELAVSRRRERHTAIEVASHPLFTWPQTLSANKWLERPELVMLVDALNRQVAKPLLLLGGPGSGKSALLSRLAKTASDGGTTVLAIRADQLTHDIDTGRKLQKHLGFSEPPAAMLRMAAEHGPAALIIDQLDALCDLIDARTQRLSVLLRLVAEVSKTPSIGIILSCRDFEFRHDHRFHELNAEVVRLAPLSFEQVGLLLQGVGIERRTLSPTLLEGLRAPQQLKMFLAFMEGKVQPPVFDTYQQVLERLWQERVVGRGVDSKREEVLEKIAEYMAEEEELGAPLARFSAYKSQIEQLKAAGVLRGEDERRIEFTHQTWFAFTQARAFITGERNLCEYVMRRDGSLFVRATLWSALVNLREADRARYRKELRALWEAQELRTHLRALLVDFLGQLQDPDNNEAGLLLPALTSNGYVRPVALGAIAGSPGWFKRIAARHLPGLMSGPHAAEVWGTLASAWPFERARVLDLLERHWINEPRCSHLALSVLRELKVWDERAVKAVLVVCNHDIAIGGQRSIWMSVLVSEIAKCDPVLALPVVRALLDQKLARCRSEAADAERKIWSHPGEELLENDHGLGDLDKLARAAPKAFLDHLWPWFVDVVTELAESKNSSIVAYVDSFGLWTLRQKKNAPTPYYALPCAIEIAVGELAAEHPVDFLALVQQWKSSDLLAVHGLLADGLKKVAPHSASQVLDYVLGDPRRLHLGDRENSAFVSCELLESLVLYLSQKDVRRLEKVIATSRRYTEKGQSPDVRLRFHQQRYDRWHRLKLLLAIQKSPHLSLGSRTLIEIESRALEDLYGRGPMSHSFIIESPMRAEQMRKAEDDHILNLFAELPDVAQRHRPSNWMQGGSAEASQALVELAKTDPRRALAIALRFEPGTHERPVAYVIEEVARSSNVQIVKELEGMILRLEAKGFSSEHYRERVAWALHRIAERIGGLSDASCALLQTWLIFKDPVEEKRARDEEKSNRPHSILLEHGGTSTFPDGNFPVLLALISGYLNRELSAHDSLLAVLEAHSLHAERSDVWRAIIKYFKFFSDIGRVVNLTSALFAAYPDVRDCVEGAQHVANICQRTDDDRLREWLDGIRCSRWWGGAQAYGEILVVLAARQPGLSWVTRSLDAVFDSSATVENRDRIQLGIAYLVVGFWSAPAHRRLSAKLIMCLIPVSSGDLAAAVAGIFGRSQSMPADEETNKVLDAFLEYRTVLAAGKPRDIIRQLKNICAEEPSRVLRLCNALLDEAMRAPDGLIPLSSAARELIDISLTLQRIHGYRKEGLDLFERLLQMGMYGARETLREFNIRPDAMVGADG